MELENRYQVPVAAVSRLDLSEEDIREILTQVLHQFPVKERSRWRCPEWIISLDKDHWLKKELFEAIASAAKNIGPHQPDQRRFRLAGQLPRVDDAQVRRV